MASNNIFSNYSISKQCKEVSQGLPGPPGPPGPPGISNTFIFNDPGRYNITVPINSSYVSVSMVGGGSYGTSVNGGASGASVVDYLLPVNNNKVTVVVGSGGTSSSTSGGDSSITIGKTTYTAGGATITMGVSKGGTLKNFNGGFNGTSPSGPNGANSSFSQGGNSTTPNGFMGSGGLGDGSEVGIGNGGNGYAKVVFLPASQVNTKV
jgi:hypothetical protein